MSSTFPASLSPSSPPLIGFAISSISTSSLPSVVFPHPFTPLNSDLPLQVLVYLRSLFPILGWITRYSNPPPLPPTACT